MTTPEDDNDYFKKFKDQPNFKEWVKQILLMEQRIRLKQFVKEHTVK